VNLRKELCLLEELLIFQQDALLRLTRKIRNNKKTRRVELSTNKTNCLIS
jgi:hypothetical protein